MIGVAAAAVLGGVDRKDARQLVVVAGLYQRLGGQPVVGMGHIEPAQPRGRLAQVPGERVAHIVDFVDEVVVPAEGAAMVVNAVDQVVASLPLAHACKDVQFVAAPGQCIRQFAHMCCHAADGNRVKGLPGKHRDAHLPLPQSQKVRYACAPGPDAPGRIDCNRQS